MLLPFQGALGAATEELTPAVREHFLQGPGVRHYRGTMRRVWRVHGWRGRAAGVLLRMGSRTETLFADTGEDIPFELMNEVNLLPDGRATMRWLRVFHFPAGVRRFDAVMLYDPEKGVILDWLGRKRNLRVELHPVVKDGGVEIVSGRQWMEYKRLLLPLPSSLAGRATIQEWQGPQSLEIKVVLSNPILGDFFGYEGAFSPASPTPECTI